MGEAIRGSSRGQEGSSAIGDTRSPVSLRDSGLYKRILGQSLNSAGLRSDAGTAGYQGGYQGATLHVVPPRSAGDELLSTSYGSVNESNTRQQQQTPINAPGVFGEENANPSRGMAAVAATTAVQEGIRHGISRKNTITRPPPSMPTVEEGIAAGVGLQDAAGGHDAPNWSKAKSSVVLLGATILYAIIAEILVDTVDVVLENFDIDEKFLGITLFALVPNTTEFLVRPEKGHLLTAR